jgi:putative DNA primase/helicase
VTAVIEASGAAIPEELRESPQWITWHLACHNGRTCKPPDAGQLINDPSTWLSYGEALLVALATDGGIGYVLNGEYYVVIDLDHVLDNEGQALLEFREIVEDAFAIGSYTEISPSGRGLHIWVRGSIDRCWKLKGREVYSRDRYITVTGRLMPGSVTGVRGVQALLDAFVAKWFDCTPRNQTRANDASPAPELSPRSPDANSTLVPSLKDEEIVVKMCAESKRGELWADLWHNAGAWKHYPAEYQSQSEADMAMLKKLRFYSRADIAQMDRMFRNSALFRTKWDTGRREKYGERTINAVIRQGGNLYNPQRGADRLLQMTQQEQVGQLSLEFWWVKRLHRYGRNALAVLAAIALYEKDGESIVDYETIGFHAAINPKNVSREVRVMEHEGIVKRHPGSHKRAPNRYSLIRTCTVVQDGASGTTTFLQEGPINTGGGGGERWLPLSLEKKIAAKTRQLTEAQFQ